MGWKGGGRIGTCELQVREEGGEADKGGYRGATTPRAPPVVNPAPVHSYAADRAGEGL